MTTAEAIHRLSQIKDTCTWIEEEIMLECLKFREPIRGIIQMYIYLRKIYHEDDILAYLHGSCAQFKDKKEQFHRVVLSSSYIANIAKKNNRGWVEPEGSVVLSEFSFLDIIFRMAEAMISLKLFPPSAKFDEVKEIHTQMVKTQHRNEHLVEKLLHITAVSAFINLNMLNKPPQ
jgi:hypothetical protein